LDGIGKPADYARRAKELGMTGIAITDHANIDGAIKWQKECLKIGVNPIVGCELYVVPDMTIKEKGEKRGHVVLLVKNQRGWISLLKMLTKANTEGFYYRPRIDFETLWENMNDGLVLMTACVSSFLHLPGGEDLLLDLMDDGMSCYLEIMPHLVDSQVKTNMLCRDLHQELKLPLVATNDCHYVLSDQAKAQEVLLAIRSKGKWNDPNRWKFDFKDLYLRTEQEMIDAFEKQGVFSRREYILAIMNSNKIGEMCWDFRIEKGEPDLPITRYEKEHPNLIADDILDHFCSQGMGDPGKLLEEYYLRYEMEMALIKKKDFARYFLIVYEIIEFCKKSGIMVGPGRGSVGGSLVAYLLGITAVDPIKYGLLFERFISQDRIDLPDIDIDFDRNKVSLVRQHIEQEYGQYNVAGISTFMSMKSRAAIRDVGRVFDIPLKEIDEVAKVIRQGEHENNAIASSPRVSVIAKNFKAKYPEVFGLSCALEGQIRGSGQHPAGLIISGQDLRESDRCNLSMRGGVAVVNWDMQDCDYSGLIKIDVLKLGTLSVLDECKRLINESQNTDPSFWYHSGSECHFVEHNLSDEAGLECDNVDFDYAKLSFDDPLVFEMISNGDTAGIFQVTGYACTKLCKEMRLDNFNDLTAVMALPRPGPLASGEADQYVKRKHGQKWKHLHPLYEEITKETYGVMIYQEQIMRAMTDLAGFTGSDADRIRKIISKKREAKFFEPYRLSFLQGCNDRQTLTQKQAETFWQGLLEWAHYSFNKSHAVEYAMIAYWTAFVKLYYPVEFLCASLTYGDEGDKEAIIKEAQIKGIQIVTPKVGISDPRKWIAHEGRVYIPFMEIKGIGESQADKCATMVQTGRKKKGFFNLEMASKKKDKLSTLLSDIKAFDPSPSERPVNLKEYFQFDIGVNRSL